MNENLAGDILRELRFIGDQLKTIADVQRQSSQANEPQLYCAPDEHCPGGFPLRRHAPEYEKGDGKDADRLYHVLPEERWFRFDGEGAFKGQTVKNHNVWRSRAVATPPHDEGDEPDDAEQPAQSQPAETPQHTWRDEFTTRAKKAGVTSTRMVVYLGAPGEHFWPALAGWAEEHYPGNLDKGMDAFIQLVAEANAEPAVTR